MRAVVFGFIAAFVLFHVTALWVTPHPHLLKTDYYALKHGFRPRLLTGTIARLLALSPDGFVKLLQLFKFGWLLVICTRIGLAIQDRLIACALCFLFAFAEPVFINDHISGFVDLAMFFWQALAACIIMSLKNRPRQPMWLCAALLPLACSVLTHEMAIFSSSVAVAWALLYYRRRALPMAVGWAALLGLYLWLTWNRRTGGGDKPSHYLTYLLHLQDQYFLGELCSLPGIAAAGGALWLVYALLGLHAIFSQPHGRGRCEYAAVLGFGVAANLFPILIASDTSRVVGGIWLACFLLVLDRAEAINCEAPNIWRYLLWAAACALQLAVPPLFITGQRADPLNPYAERLMPRITDPQVHNIWTLTPLHAP